MNILLILPSLIHNNGLWFFPFLCVCPSITTAPSVANGPMDMIFGMGMDIDDRMPIFGKSMSKVKVIKVQKNMTVTFSDRC